MSYVSATLAVPSIAPGSVIADRYEVRALIGAGGMGAVYRVLDRELDEEVALKVLHAASGDALVRFRREVKLARRVTHPNVARTFDLGTHGDVRFLTMELLAGESVAQRFRGVQAPLGETLRIAADVARGLAAAHAASVVHRDLKPDNIMLSQDRVIITDFGIARLQEAANQADAMKTGSIVGTPAYMAPEQVEAGVIDGRTDVYALGVMLYELLSGKLPFHGDTPIAMAVQRLTSTPPALGANIPAPVSELVRAALSRRREDRPDAPMILDRIEGARGRAAVAVRGSIHTTLDVLPSPEQVRSVVVRAFEADDASSALAKDIASAIADALAETKGVRVVPPAFAQTADSPITLEGSVRSGGDRARIRMRLLDSARSTQLWAHSIDGALSDSFSLEDAASQAVLAAIRKHVARGADEGPHDPKLREIYDRAKAARSRFGVPYLREAMELLEQVLVQDPNEPHTMALLASCLLIAWRQYGATDTAMAARAEELALRAIALEPSIAEAYHVVAGLRAISGELRACLRAEEETLRRNPLHAGAHLQLARFLCESGRVEEGLRRLDLVQRLSPNDVMPILERARTIALLGQRDEATKLLDAARARSGPLSTIVFDTRLAVWFNDRELAAECAARIRAEKSGASWDRAAPIMDSVASGVFDPESRKLLGMLTSQLVATRHRSMMLAISAEYFAIMKQRDDALAALEESVQSATIDILWIDRCPALDSLRDDARFVASRAVIASRVAELWA